MRQFICSLIGVAAAVGIYFGLSGPLGRETVSWLCVLVAAPFAIAGFFSYNSMTLERFIVAWFRSEFLCAGPRKFAAENYYWQMLNTARPTARQIKRMKRTKQKQRGKRTAVPQRKPQQRRTRH